LVSSVRASLVYDADGKKLRFSQAGSEAGSEAERDVASVVGDPPETNYPIYWTPEYDSAFEGVWTATASAPAIPRTDIAETDVGLNAWALPPQFSSDGLIGTKIGRSGRIEGSVLDTYSGVTAASELTYSSEDLVGATVVVNLDGVSYIFEVTEDDLGLDWSPDHAAATALTSALDCGDRVRGIVVHAVALTTGVVGGAAAAYYASTVVPAATAVRFVASIGQSLALPIGGYRTFAKGTWQMATAAASGLVQSASDLYDKVQDYRANCP